MYLVGELVLQVEVFLTLVMDFDAHTGDASYTVGVVSFVALELHPALLPLRYMLSWVLCWNP